MNFDTNKKYMRHGVDQYAYSGRLFIPMNSPYSFVVTDDAGNVISFINHSTVRSVDKEKYSPIEEVAPKLKYKVAYRAFNGDWAISSGSYESIDEFYNSGNSGVPPGAFLLDGLNEKMKEPKRYQVVYNTEVEPTYRVSEAIYTSLDNFMHEWNMYNSASIKNATLLK